MSRLLYLRPQARKLFAGIPSMRDGSTTSRDEGGDVARVKEPHATFTAPDRLEPSCSDKLSNAFGTYVE